MEERCVPLRDAQTKLDNKQGIAGDMTQQNVNYVAVKDVCIVQVAWYWASGKGETICLLSDFVFPYDNDEYGLTVNEQSAAAKSNSCFNKGGFIIY